MGLFSKKKDKKAKEEVKATKQEKPAKSAAKAEAKPAEKKEAKPVSKSAPRKEEPKKAAASSKPAEKKSEVKKPAVKKQEAKPAKTYHISKRKDENKWQIKAEGAEKAVKFFNTQAEAIAYGKRLADKQDANIMIHKEDGSFRKLTY